MPPVSAVGTLPLTTCGACDPGRHFQRSPSHVPCQSRRPGSRRLHAGHHLASPRDARQAHHGKTTKSPAFDAISNCANDASTAHTHPEKPQAGCFLERLPGPHLTRQARLFPDRSPRRSSANAARGGLAPSPEGRRWRANKPPSPAQHRLERCLLHDFLLSVRDARPSHKPTRSCETDNAGFPWPHGSASDDRRGPSETETAHPRIGTLSQTHKKSTAQMVCATASAHTRTRVYGRRCPCGHEGRSDGSTGSRCASNPPAGPRGFRSPSYRSGLAGVPFVIPLADEPSDLVPARLG